MLLNPYRFQSAPAGLWAPSNMAVPPPVYLDAGDSVITASGGSVSAISNLGSLGASGEFSQSDSAKRPTIVSGALNAQPILRFDGTNDVLTCNTTEGMGIFANVPAAWVFAVYKKRTTDATPTARYLLYTAIPSGAVRFGLLCGDSTAGMANKPLLYARRLDADSPASLPSPNSVSGNYCLSFAHANFSTREGVMRENGVQVASSATLTAAAGNTSNTSPTTYHPLAVGAFVTGSLASNVDIACLVIGNTNPSAGEVAKLEGWAAHKWGLTASLPAGHPYKTTAPTI